METYVPLALPPGVKRTGTLYGSSKNRWADSHLIRWVQETIRPVGGWELVRTATGGIIQASGLPRGSVAWRANDRSGWLAVGTSGPNTKAYAYSDGALTDITPAGIVAGSADGMVSGGSIGWGEGGWGEGGWGGGFPAGTIIDADTWSLDNFGEMLLGCLTGDGKLYSWDKNVANDFVQITNAPTSCRALVVTQERFLFALGAGGDPRKVQWAARETLTTWTPSASNNAGSYILQTSGRLLRGIRSPRETLLWTDTDLWAATFLGQPFTYRFDQRADACGLLGPDSVAMGGDGVAYWMGDKQFYAYGGSVRPVPCDVLDHVFGDFNFAQRAKVSAFAIPAYNEIWWFYPSVSQSGSENDRYVTYNYLYGYWQVGYIGRAAGVEAGVFSQPMLWDKDGQLYAHETGHDRGDEVPYVESGPLEIGNGEQVARVQKLIADEAVLGQVEATFFAAFQPMATERTYGPYPITAETNIRFTGRQVRVKFSEAIDPVSFLDGSFTLDGSTLLSGEAGQDFRIGNFRLGVIAGGRR